MLRAVRAAFRVVLSVCAVSAFAQTGPVCHGPAEIESAVTKQPSADSYNALGAWFARRNQTGCAIPAFRSAIRLSPSAWDGHYNLALALMNARDFPSAIKELRQADKLSPGRAPVHAALGISLQES